jgi:hypothetical protein
MRLASVLWVLSLAGLAATPAAAQDPAALAEGVARSPALWDSVVPAAAVSAAPRVVPSRDSVVRERKPQAGPRLPDFVAPVRLPAEPAPAAPSGNIVIPVTTALIVLAVVVLVLLID